MRSESGPSSPVPQPAMTGRPATPDRIGDGVRSDLSELRSLVLDYETFLAFDWHEFVKDFSQKASSIGGEAVSELRRIRERHEAQRAAVDARDPSAGGTNLPPEIGLPEAAAFPEFKENWWKVALGAVVLGWVTLGFAAGLALGVAAAAGLAAILMVKHNNHVGALGALSQRCRDDRAAIARQEAQATQASHAKVGPAVRKLVEAWDDGCQEVDRRTAECQRAVQQILARNRGRLTGFADDAPPPDPARLHFDEQIAFRIGERSAFTPSCITPDLVSWLPIQRQPAAMQQPVPIFLDLSEKRALLIHGHNQPAGTAPHNILPGIMARILGQIPPGKAIFTLIDPLGLGNNFAPFLKLQDYSEGLINGMVWSGRDQIRRRLEDLIEHVENVTQKYLRADFPDIESYNREAGEIAEPYRFLIVCDFPEGFTEDAIRDLVRLIQNGPRCGVHTLLYWNRTGRTVYGLDEQELGASCIHLQRDGSRELLLSENLYDPARRHDTRIRIDAGPSPSLTRKLVERFGEHAVEAMKVEVPFGRLFALAGLTESWWTGSTRDGIVVPLGPVGANKALSITLDSRLSHNALIVGRPGSGKSNLLHVFISMVTHRYSPDEVELYLVDFKKGVEFKDYANARLPHARVIAVETEREFGLSVLRALDSEMTVRSEMFKQADGAGSIGEYRERRPDARMPRAVLIVDEFQEFFTIEDKIKEESATLFDRLVRQGRSFGIHVILGTQSLSNAHLAKPTVDQIPVRIALQCSDADSRLILADDNVAARSLGRPGEAIYNDRAGLLEGNRQFQVALYPAEERKAQLASMLQVAAEHAWRGDAPRIFEGHEPPSLETCRQIRRYAPVAVGSAVRAWIGEPVSLDPPIHIALPPQGGRNMLVVTREERQAVDVALATLLSLVAQLPPRDLEINIVDLTTADTQWAGFSEHLRDSVPHRVNIYGARAMRELLQQLAQVVAERHEQANGASGTRRSTGQRKLLVILGAHRARDLRSRDEGGSIFSYARADAPAERSLHQLLGSIVADGPEAGVHTILWTDSVANFERIFERRALDEFGIRLSGALTDADSQTLFDSYAAAQIRHPNRMLSYDDERVGVYTLFRPYQISSESFFGEIGGELFRDSRLEA